MKLQPLGVGVAVGAALLFGLAVGVINGLLVTRIGIPPFIATLGSMTVVQGLMLTYTQQQPIPGSRVVHGLRRPGSLGPVPVPALFLTAVAIFCYWWLNHTRSGRNIYAVGGNPDAARLAGIDLDLYRFLPIPSWLLRRAGVLLASLLNTSTIHIGLDTPLASWPRRSWAAPAVGGRGSAARFSAFSRSACSRTAWISWRLYLLPDRHSRGDPGRRGGDRQLLHEPPPDRAAAGARGVGLRVR